MSRELRMNVVRLHRAGKLRLNREPMSLPDAVTDAEGALLEPLGVALHAMNLGKVQVGASVGAFGCGPIGLLIVQLAGIADATQTDKLLPHISRLSRTLQ